MGGWVQREAMVLMAWGALWMCSGPIGAAPWRPSMSPRHIQMEGHPVSDSTHHTGSTYSTNTPLTLMKLLKTVHLETGNVGHVTEHIACGI